MSASIPPLKAWADVLHERQTVRRFRPEPIPLAQIERLVSAATRAPSAHNRQPWRFCVLAGKPGKLALADAMGRRLRADRERDGDAIAAIDADVRRSHDRITAAPLAILVCVTMEEMDRYPDARRAGAEWVMAVQSTAMAGGNLLLAAEAEGLGACWMCAPLFCPEEVRQALNLRATWVPQGLVLLGYPAEAGKFRQRKPLAEVMTLR
jgi:coenzyme F420-0:L-glutamate ligase / coenzyme F420-1:gamma-L-glutamate ligase